VHKEYFIEAYFKWKNSKDRIKTTDTGITHLKKNNSDIHQITGTFSGINKYLSLNPP